MPRRLPHRPQRVLVTGGASGLGLALARRMAVRGDQVVVGDLGAERPPSVPRGIDYLPLDVRDPGAWSGALDWVRDTWGGLDLLVNNAGVGAGGRIDVESLDEWDRIVDINLLGVVRGCRTFTPLLKEQGHGQIANIASLAGLAHAPGMASYNATKAAVVALSETLRFELAPHGITVSVVCPYFFRTNLHHSMQGDDAALQAAGRRYITNSPRSADDVAAVALSGIDAGHPIVLTETLGRVAFWGKRLARPVYAAVLARTGRDLARSATRVTRVEA